MARKVSSSYTWYTNRSEARCNLLGRAAVLAHVLAVLRVARAAEPASGRVHREQLSPRRQRARAGELAPNATRCLASRRRCSCPSIPELYVAARPPPLRESMRAHQVRMTRANTRTSHRPDRPSHTHSRASPSVLPQTTHHRRSVESTSCWRQERRGHHQARLHSRRRGRRRPSARAAARGVAVVMTAAARVVHVEHVGAAGRRPARACAAAPVAETLQGSRPGPGPPIQSMWAAGEPLQSSARLL